MGLRSHASTATLESIGNAVRISFGEEVVAVKREGVDAPTLFFIGYDWRQMR